jgi:hypothetical protein
LKNEFKMSTAGGLDEYVKHIDLAEQKVGLTVKGWRGEIRRLEIKEERTTDWRPKLTKER